jgi:uncharacterized membrane protein YhaH (DUF805 family)
MKPRTFDLWRLDGTIDRVPYFALGVALSFIKMGLDYLVAVYLFGKDWSPLEYAVPSQVSGLLSMPPEDRFFYRAMLLVALPFILCGVALTVRRLRSAGLPRWLVVFFFAPMPVNLIFYLVMSLLPARPVELVPVAPRDDEFDLPGPVKKPGMLDRTIPENKLAAAVAAILLPMPFALAFSALSVHVFKNYGWGVFVGIPFALPMISVILYGYRRPRPVGECLALGMFWLAIAYAMLLVLAFEGMICLIMALPLAVPIVLLGSVVGYLIQAVPLKSRDASRLMLVLLAALPAMIGAESATCPKPPLYEVRTALAIDAPPERVWQHVIRFDALPEPGPGDWIFHTGLAYPVRAEIEGQGVGAVRRCEFSTGPFIEPIETWDEPRLLRFAVTSNPPPMREWNPITEIHPPHLDRFFVSHRGEFRLTPLPRGRTLLAGTTWYEHGLWPAPYWKIWSDLIVHQIHRRVLEHIKRSAEDGLRRTNRQDAKDAKTRKKREEKSSQGDRSADDRRWNKRENRD